MKTKLALIFNNSRYHLLFSFVLSIPIILTTNIIAVLPEAFILGFAFWVFLFIISKISINQEEINEFRNIIKLRNNDHSFLPTILLLITTYFLCLIPYSLFFGNILTTTDLFSLESLNIYYLIYLISIPATMIIFSFFIGISTVLIDIPISLIIKLSKSDLSVFEWLFHRKIKGKQIYQADNFIIQYSLFTIVRTSFYYIIQVTGALYTVYYGLVIALGVEITINKIEILMGILALVIFVNTLFWHYYKRELFINELGLVEKDSVSKLIRKVDSSLFEKSLKNYFSAPLVFSILSALPEVPRIIANLSDYFDLLLFSSIFALFFIFQLIQFYIDLKTDQSNILIKDNLIRKNNIKLCQIDIQIKNIDPDES